MHTHPSVYLAGAIRGLSFGQATSWRSEAKALLAEDGITAFSPLRAKEYLAQEADVGQSQRLADAYPDYPLSTPKAIVARDRFDCQRADVVLMNLVGARSVSIGSVMEIAWADAARVPIVLVMEKDGSNPHEHAMVREMCSFQTDTLAEAIDVVRSILLA